jgi:hypothetical protein
MNEAVVVTRVYVFVDFCTQESDWLRSYRVVWWVGCGGWLDRTAVANRRFKAAACLRLLSQPNELRWLRAGMCGLKLVLPHRGESPRRIDNFELRLGAKLSPSAALHAIGVIRPGHEQLKMLRDLSEDLQFARSSVTCRRCDELMHRPRPMA